MIVSWFICACAYRCVMADEQSSWHDALRSLDSDACDDLSECAVQRNWSAALDALSESADSQELEADGACKQGD